MKKFSMLMITLLFLFSTGCSSKQPVNSVAVAHKLSEDQLENRHLTEKVDMYFGENVEAYKMSDGKTIIYLYSSAIEKTCNTIKQTENGDFVAEGDYYSKSLPQKFSLDSSIYLGNYSNSMTILPQQDKDFNGELCTKVNMFSQERQATIYKDFLGKGQNLYCFSTAFGVNTEVVIPKKAEEFSFKIKIQLPNLVPDTGSPDYILFKTALEKGEVKSILYTPLLCDSKGKWSYANSVKLIEKDSVTNTYTVEYTADKDFLNDKKTKYPLTLNQSIHLYKSKQPDTSAYEKTGDEAGHYLSPYMLLGDKTIKGEGWTFIRYETLNNLDIDPQKIVSAKYVFRNLFDLEKEAKIGAYAVIADWCSINTRWFNRPPFDEKPISEVIIQKAGDYKLDITSLFKEMIENKGEKNAKYSVQNSFLIKSETENTNMIFSSGDNGLFSPLLEIVLSE